MTGPETGASLTDIAARFDAAMDAGAEDVTDVVENDPGPGDRGKRGADVTEPEVDDLVEDDATDDDPDGDDDRAVSDDLDADEFDLKAADDDTGEDDDTDETKGKGKAPETLEALAEQSGFEVENMLETIEHTFDVDGKKVTATLGDLVRSHEGMENVNARLEEVETQRTDLNKMHGEAAKEFRSKVGRLGAVLQATEQALMADSNSPAMQQLRVTNPAEWSARMQEFQTRQGQVQQLFGQVAQEWDAHKASVEEQRKTELTERVTAEGKKTKAAIPKWDKAYETALMGYISSTGGFSKAELEADPVIDHRMLVIADKARKYDALVAKGKTKKAAPAAKAKSKTLDPVKGAGGKAPTETTTVTTGGSRRSSREMIKARKALKKSGSMNDAADVFNQRLGVQ